MQELVAFDLAGGQGFVDSLRRAWDDGDAVLVIDRRLPAMARDRLIAAARPHRLVDDTGSTVLDRGAPRLEDGDRLVVASSGTTGDPKLLVHTETGLTAHARAVHDHLGVGRGDRWLACLPLAHIGGLGVVVRAVLDDVPVDVIDGFDAGVVAAAPERLGTTLVSLVTTALDRIPVDGFRWVVLGGSADPTPRPANVVHTYGSTESGGGVVYGRTALPGVEVRITDAGAIGLRSRSVARGRRTPDGAVTAVVDLDGWLWTGDLGRWSLDESGDRYLTVEGRADDLIVTGGQNVWPTPVEDLLRGVAGVADVAVIGVDDVTWGQRVVAVVVPDADGPPSLADLRTSVAEHLPAYAAPKELRLVASLPRTALGKLQRRAVAAATLAAPQ